MKRIFCSISGSILMETVLIIPLYLVALSGIFWVGDLALLRSKSTFFDRVASWCSGNRHDEKSSSAIQNDLNQNFLEASKVGNQQVDQIRLRSKGSGEAWSFIAGASVTVSAEPPVWTQGWRQVGMLMMGEQDRKLEKRSFQSRETDSEWMHQTLMRTSDKYRDSVTPKQLAEKMEWLNRVYASPWPDSWTQENSPSVSGASPCMEYERHNKYVEWSE